MSPRETFTRVRYEAYCRVERVRHARGAFERKDRVRDAIVPSLARSADWKSALLRARAERRKCFFAGAEQRDATRAMFVSRFPAEHIRAREEAERVLRGEFAFFGGEFRYHESVEWHLDPVTHAEWPKVYHRDVPIHGGDVGFGDVKHVWELGRQQFVIDLAKAWAIDRIPACAAGARHLILGWRNENPVGTGVAWSCALEPAFRVLSWLWAYFLTLDDPSFDEESHVSWLEGFGDHGWFLYRHLEYYASPFNHLIGEACALYCLGVLFPEFRESRKWRAHGRHILESRVPSQFYIDGGSVEQSTFYHHATTGFYLLAALLGRQNGEEFSPVVWSGIERALEFSMVMQQPDGTTPSIGGADDGKPIRLEHRPLWDFRHYLAIGAVVFKREDFKAAAGGFFEDALWLLGAEGATCFDAIVSQAPNPPSRALESSGYVVIRDQWSPTADYICFDCGEQAAGLRRDDIASAAHGHADSLSLIVWRKGRPVLVDPGFHCYNGPKAWQDHFRETAAHNTLRIDGRDQALHINKMAWSHTYAATLEQYSLRQSDGWAVASHDGYRLLEKGPVRHRRAVWARARGYIVIADFLEGSGTHEVELTFQFAPGSLCLGATRATFDDRNDLHWFSASRLDPRAYEGGLTPDAGWIAPSLGIKAAAPRLVLAGTATMPATILTILTDAAPAPLAVASADSSVMVSGDNWTDWLLVRGIGHNAVLKAATDAPLAAWQCREQHLVADGRIGGTYQHSCPRP